ncbi:sulfatase-like hydrolase/transferase [bacterium]|nr:sulfatase-like hydrolase/transferase [bacterium]
MPVQDRPNILVIMTDQQQYKTVNPPSGKDICPNLTKLSEEGIIFTRNYTPAPPCAPARTSTVTTVYPHSHGMLNNCHISNAVQREINKNCDSFGQRLKDSGYNMNYLGTWHAGFETGPIDRGFDTKNRIFPGPKIERTIEDSWSFNFPGFNDFLLYGRSSLPAEKEISALVTDAILEELGNINEHSNNKPWFCWANYYGPHDPFIAPEPYASMYNPDDIKIPESFFDKLEDKPNVYRRMKEQWFRDIKEEHVRKATAYYWGYCSYIDAQIGRIIKFLDEGGLRENTLVVFTSDHGEMLGAHNMFFKGIFSFEECIRVPLIMRWPSGIKNPGRICEGLTSLLDLGPTFLDIADAEGTDPCHGKSLLPVLKGEREKVRDTLMVENHGNIFVYVQRILLKDNYKLVFNGFDYDELYDLEKDPWEMKNLVREKSHQNIYDEMQESLWEEMMAMDDPYSMSEFGAAIFLKKKNPMSKAYFKEKWNYKTMSKLYQKRYTV